MNTDLLKDLIEKLDENGTSVFESSASAPNREGDYAETPAEMESLEEGGDTLRGKVVHKVGKAARALIYASSLTKRQRRKLLCTRLVTSCSRGPSSLCG